jgi:hypothetical protein
MPTIAPVLIPDFEEVVVTATIMSSINPIDLI